MLVSGDDRHVICFGTETTIADSSTQDNMFLRWSGQDDQNVWTPTATNTAGSKRLVDGNFIQTAVRSRGAVLIWTDTALYQMQFIGPPLTFGFNQFGSACGCIGLPLSMWVVYLFGWAQTHSSYLMVPCKRYLVLCKTMYLMILIKMQNKIYFVQANTDFNEVMWFYPSLILLKSIEWLYLIMQKIFGM